MKPLPPRPGARSGASPEPVRRNSYLIYLPGGVPVLRAAVEELLKSGWDEAFRRRASDIACAFEGSFRASGHADLAVIARSISSLLELSHREVADLGAPLHEKLGELLGHLERLIGTDEETQTA